MNSFWGVCVIAKGNNWIEIENYTNKCSWFSELWKSDSFNSNSNWKEKLNSIVGFKREWNLAFTIIIHSSSPWFGYHWIRFISKLFHLCFGTWMLVAGRRRWKIICVMLGRRLRRSTFFSRESGSENKLVAPKSCIYLLMQIYRYRRIPRRHLLWCLFRGELEGSFIWGFVYSWPCLMWNNLFWIGIVSVFCSSWFSVLLFI